MKPQQLALSIRLHDHTRLENFVSEDEDLIQKLTKLVLVPSHQFGFVWGGHGTGKTHLLCALNHYCKDIKRKSIYFSLNEPNIAPTIFENLEDFEVVFIDDVDFVVEKPQWQEALFHLYNRMQENQGVLITSALASPKGLGLSLKDLESRLTWGAVFQIKPLSDEKKQTLLQMRANALGMTTKP